MGDDNSTQQTPAVSANPEPESYLHSIATSLGIDPEAVKDTARAVLAHPHDALHEISDEAATELENAATHPLDTLKQAATGVVDQITNPEAAKVARARYNLPGVGNKAAGVAEAIGSAVPLIGGNIVKSQEQAVRGNLPGAAGTLTGTLAPVVLEEGARQAGEAVHEAGAAARENMAARHEASLQEARTGKVIEMPGAPKELPAAPKALPAAPVAEAPVKISTDNLGIKWAENKDGIRVSIPKSVASEDVPAYAQQKLTEQADAQATLKNAPHITFEEAGGAEVAPPSQATNIDTTAVEPQFKQTLASRGQLPGQTVNLSPAGSTYVGHQLEARKAMTNDSLKQGYIDAVGTTTGSDLLPIPKRLLDPGQTPEAVIAHEMGHALELDRMGEKWGTGIESHPLEVLSHLHPTMLGAGGTAAIAVPWDKVPGATIQRNGNYGFNQDALRAVLPDLLHVYLAGGAFAHLTHSAAPDAGMASDNATASQLLRAGGFTEDEAENMIDATHHDLHQQWNNPDILNLIRGAAAGREEGLSKTLHMSSERLQNIRDRVRQLRQEALSGQKTSNTPASAGAGSTISTTVAEPGGAGLSAEGNLREGNGEAVSPVAESRGKQAVTQNPPIGYIRPDGQFEQFNGSSKLIKNAGYEATHEDFAANRDTDQDALQKEGWVRKAGLGSYDAGHLTPQTTKAIENDLIHDYADIKKANRTNQSFSIVLETADGTFDIPVDDFIEKYNGDLGKAMRAVKPTGVSQTVKTAPKNELAEAAVKKYGVTDNPTKMGFILPDGRGLDFSEGRPARTLDHGDVSSILPRKGDNAVAYNENPREVFADRTGAARILISRDGVNIVLPESGMTPEQNDVILRAAEKHPGDVTIDIRVKGKIGSASGSVTNADSLDRLVRDAKKDARTPGAGTVSVRPTLESKAVGGIAPEDQKRIQKLSVDERGRTEKGMIDQKGKVVIAPTDHDEIAQNGFGAESADDLLNKGGVRFASYGPTGYVEVKSKNPQTIHHAVQVIQNLPNTHVEFDFHNGVDEPFYTHGEIHKVEGKIQQWANEGTVSMRPNLETAPANQGVPTGSKFVASSPEEYRAELDKSPRKADFLQESADQLRDHKIFKLQTPDGKDTGIAYSITPGGEMRGMVNNGPYAGASALAVKSAFENGATHTQPAWDVNGRLAKVYNEMGGGHVVSEPYDETKAESGPPSDAMKAAWRKAGWKDGDPYPNFTKYEKNQLTGGYVPPTADNFFMFASPEEHAAQKEGFRPGDWNMENVRPNAALQGSAQKFAQAQGMPEISHAPVVQDLDRARAIAQQYEAAKHDPNDPQVKAAYDALKSETKAQFHHLRDDLGLKFEPTEKDPYVSAQAMMHDIRQNNRLKVFTGSGPGADHPLSEIDPETGESYNTLFRWVHDAYGHAAGGNDFSENGEKSATEAHAQMYSPTARPAMRAETEGQTSHFFHNPAVESGEKQPGEFAPQKATLVHDWNEVAGTRAAKEPAGGINPRTGQEDKTGLGLEIYPELRQPLNRAPTSADFQKFYEQHKGIFDQNPELRVGWDNDSREPGGHEINIGAVGPGAVKVAGKLDQYAAYDIAKGKNIDAGGTGKQTQFPDYPLEDRLKDLRTEPESFEPGKVLQSKPELFSALDTAARKKLAMSYPKGSTPALQKYPLTIEGTADSGHATILDFAGAMNKWAQQGLKPNKEIAAAMDRARAELKYQLANDNSGLSWYKKDTADAIDTLKANGFPELKTPLNAKVFRTLWGITSYGVDPDVNMTSAAEAWKQYQKTGKIPLKANSITNWPGYSGIQGSITLLNKLIDEKGEQGAMDWLYSKHPVSEIREQKMKTHGTAGVPGKADDEKYGAFIFGPKAGAYTLNLQGVSDHTTVDVWGARMIRRWTGTLTPESMDQLVTPKEARDFHGIVDSMGKDLGLDNATVQAVLWQYEHDLYAAHGVGEAAKSYKGAAEKYVQRQQDGSTRDFIAEQSNLFAERLGKARDEAQATRQNALATGSAGGAPPGGQKDTEVGDRIGQCIGNCKNESLIDDIFGSVSEFARQVEENGDNFTYRGVQVRYNPKTDTHSFYEAPEAGDTSFDFGANVKSKSQKLKRGISGLGKK